MKREFELLRFFPTIYLQVMYLLIRNYRQHKISLKEVNFCHVVILDWFKIVAV